MLFAILLTLASALPASASGAEFPLTINQAGSGSGNWECEVEGGDPEPCEAEYPAGTELSVLADSDPGSEFLEFFGDCGPLACELTMDEAHEATIVFELEDAPEFALNVEAGGEGVGEVLCAVSPLGLPEPCETEYPAGTELTLVAEPELGSEFLEWEGDCASAGTEAECELEIDGEKTVEAIFDLEPSEFALNIEEPGTGSGDVTCEAEEGPEPCRAEYPAGTAVYLTAEAETGSEFVEWSGCDNVSGPGDEECEVEMSEEKTLEVVFELEGGEPSLTIKKAGSGSGEVECEVEGGGPEACAASYPNATALEVIATANAGSSFAGYSAGTGSATGCTASPCAFTIEADSEVTATFNLKPIPKFKLKVKRTGTGTGKVESTSPPSPRIDCGSECEAEFEEGTKVTLARSASAGSKFIEWGGACSGTGTCEVTMSAAREVTARFDLVPKFKLTISKSGTGTGKVTSAPSGIDCGLICSAEYEEGKEVELKEAASAGSEFVKWTGACSEASTCKVTMSAAKEVTAEFKLLPKPKFKLTISKSGTGTGTVTSSPPGISCGSTCSAEYEEGKEVELKEAASAGSEFTEWSGACTGTGACRVTMSAARSVGARFDAVPTFTLSVSRLGTGAGTVTSSPAGIECGEACAAEFEEGTEVELLATPEEGSEFKEWAGACTGTGACRVRMNAARSVRAVFRATPTYKLTVAKSGTGQGTVRSAPPIEAIDCGTTCEARLALGTEVELIATPDPGSEFFKWSGACTGNGPCEVTMSAARTAHATFKEVPRLKLSVTRSGPGTVTSSPPGISCGSECEHEYGPGTAIALSATPARGYRLKALTGCDSVAGSTCTVRMSAPRVVGATFVLARCKKGFRKEKVNGKARCVHRRHRPVKGPRGRSAGSSTFPITWIGRSF